MKHDSFGRGQGLLSHWREQIELTDQSDFLPGTNRILRTDQESVVTFRESPTFYLGFLLDSLFTERDLEKC